MKNKIVLWGKNEQEEKILLAIELIDKENMVKIHQFPAAVVTEEFNKQLMTSWKNGEEVPFPAEVVTLDRPLSVTDDLLPETILVDRTDVISRAKAEWHFVVLSSKLYELYSSELADIKEKVTKMDEYKSSVWEEMKGFWTKVQQQVYDKNLFREHANNLRKGSDEVFESLKSMRKSLDNEFKAESKKHYENFLGQLDEIKTKIESGKSLQPLFEELKKMQSTFKNIKFTRDDRNKLWNKIDAAFKILKEKKYGKSGEPSASNALGRLKNRYEGLMKAIDRMKGSIEKDLRDKNGQSQQAGRAMGQLEAQLREARVGMINERINSKQVKLKDMIATKAELEKRMAKEEARAKKQAERAEMDAKKQEKKEEIKQKIAKESKSAVDPAEAEKLKKAAEQIAESKKNKNVIPPIVAAVTESEVNPAAEAISPEPQVQEEEPAVVEEPATNEEPKVETDGEDSIMDKIEDAIEDIGEVIEDVVDALKDKAEEVIEVVKEAAKEAKDNIDLAMNEEE